MNKTAIANINSELQKSKECDIASALCIIEAAQYKNKSEIQQRALNAAAELLEESSQHLLEAASILRENPQ